MTCSAVSTSVDSLVIKSKKQSNWTKPLALGSTIERIRWKSISPWKENYKFGWGWTGTVARTCQLKNFWSDFSKKCFVIFTGDRMCKSWCSLYYWWGYNPYNKMCQEKWVIQWGSEIRPFENRNHSKTGLFEDRLSNGPVFKWLGLQSIPFENRPFENRNF